MYENFKREVEQEVKRFRNEVKKIQTSKNPYYANVDVQNYEISKLRGELEMRISAIKKQFNDDIDGQIAVYEERAAKSFFKPSETDKKLVAEYISEFLADTKLAYTEKDKLEAFENFESKLGYLDENGLHEVRRHLPNVFDQLASDKALASKLKGLNATLRELKTAEQAQLDELKEMKINGIDWAYRRLRLTHPSFSDYQNNQHNPNRIPL